ncbi:MAG: ClpXP protease specificity-enhancing factor [Pseudomonadota bacterium]
MTQSTKPYLMRAIYEWCMDQGFTPYIAVVVDERTVVPRQYVRDGQIVLNIGHDATHQLVMGNELITFNARFGGVAHSLSIPVDNVAAIYARENGQGMAFEIAPAMPAEDAAPAEGEPSPPSEPTPPGRPRLTRIK